MKITILFCLWLVLILNVACEKTTAPTVTDIDGNVYPVIKIGNQYWMAQNLRVTRYNNGDSISNLSNSMAWSNTRTGARCYYHNDTSFGRRENLGCLYNWYAISDPRKLAPKGWHLPAAAELDTLVKNLQGDTLAGAYLKAYGWSPPNARIPVSNGFNALPGGYRINDGGFYTLGSNGYWWHTHGSYELFAWSPRFYSTFADVRRDPQYYTYGLSVRCIKD